MSYFISFEGGEGAGKSTIIPHVAQMLNEEGYEVVCTREPGGIEIAEQIRHIILDKSNTNMDARTEALLYAAARRQHLVEKVIPALQKGCIVLCDRFIDSSLAYQGYARGLGVAEIEVINQFAIDGYMPKLTILLDIDPKVGLTRIQQDRSREVNRLDLEALDFHYRVREGYLRLAEKYSTRIKRVDATYDIDQVIKQTVSIITNFLTNQNKLK